MEGDMDEPEQTLRTRLSALTEEARKNAEAWQRAQRRELDLLEAATLGELLERLTEGLRSSYRLRTVTLALADPEHEIRHLLMVQGQRVADYPATFFVDSVQALAPQLATSGRPWLGRYVRSDHALVFAGDRNVASAALLPLIRQDRMIGSLNMGSDEPNRFTESHATDFLQHLAIIAAFSLENAVNRARLIRSGFTDVLTGWHNRRYLQARLREELARCRRENSALTCLMIDVDHFKRINDLYGHLAGDQVLHQVAHCIEAEVRSSDVAARYGGEEFVILLPATGRQSGGFLGERIRRAVAAERFEIDGRADPVPITVSIGVAEYQPDARQKDLKVAGERLLALADVALYEAKAAGRNNVSVAANG
jgi:diguanylate cyclase (GGDEF)-like protein